MAIRVDPFLLPLPKQLLLDKETRVFFEYQNRFLHDLWYRTGGGTDLIAESQIGELYEPGIQTSDADELIEGLDVDSELFSKPDSDSSERIEELELDAEMFAAHTLDNTELEVVVVTADYTTTGNQVVVVNSTTPVVITANESPGYTEFFHVIRYGTGAVNVQSTNLINGQANKSIIRRYTAPKHLFIAELNTWNTI